MKKFADDVEMTSRTRDEERVPTVSIGEGDICFLRDEEVKERNVSDPT